MPKRNTYACVRMFVCLSTIYYRDLGFYVLLDVGDSVAYGANLL